MQGRLGGRVEPPPGRSTAQPGSRPCWGAEEGEEGQARQPAPGDGRGGRERGGKGPYPSLSHLLPTTLNLDREGGRARLCPRAAPAAINSAQAAGRPVRTAGCRSSPARAGLRAPGHLRSPREGRGLPRIPRNRGEGCEARGSGGGGDAGGPRAARGLSVRHPTRRAHAGAGSRLVPCRGAPDLVAPPPSASARSRAPGRRTSAPLTPSRAIDPAARVSVRAGLGCGCPPAPPRARARALPGLPAAPTARVARRRGRERRRRPGRGRPVPGRGRRAGLGAPKPEPPAGSLSPPPPGRPAGTHGRAALRPATLAAARAGSI